jgi:hypothetical protein
LSIREGQTTNDSRGFWPTITWERESTLEAANPDRTTHNAGWRRATI